MGRSRDGGGQDEGDEGENVFQVVPPMVCTSGKRSGLKRVDRDLKSAVEHGIGPRVNGTYSSESVEADQGPSKLMWLCPCPTSQSN